MSENTVYGWNESMDVSLMQKLKDDLKTAMRSKDDDAKSAIRMVMGELPKLTVPITLESGKKSTRLKKQEEITNDELITIIRGLVKSEKIVLEIKNEASSPYLECLSAYLPQMLGEDVIADWIKTNIDLSQFKSPMQAMGPVMKHFGKQTDGKMVQEILKKMA